MEELRQHLKQIRVPNQNDKVYKDECVFSFDNPVSTLGLCSQFQYAIRFFYISFDNVIVIYRRVIPAYM